MSISQLTGTPWHKERVHRAEGDDRRYKGRCKYFNYESESCSKAAGKCHGSAHCDYYKAISEEEFKARQKANQKYATPKPKEDECFWY